jgi:hypothetical protein
LASRGSIPSVGGSSSAGAELTFGGGNTFLDDDIVVDDELGLVLDEDPLALETLHAINGNFEQDSSGVLDLEIANDATGQ